MHDTRTKRAAIQNGWWGPKILAWAALVVVSFAIPNGFFIFWSKHVANLGSVAFILIGLVLLIDFVHTWSETCLAKWEEHGSEAWKWILIVSTLAQYAGVVALTVVDYVYFGQSGCGLNQFFITFNLILCILATALSISPPVQEANPRSGLAQSGMVAIYVTYLVTSAVANHKDSDGKCNPLTARADAARSSMVVVGAIFTFLAIAYSTSRAATSSKAFAGKKSSSAGGGAIQLPTDDDSEMGRLDAAQPPIVRDQPSRKDSVRIQAMMAAVAAGSIPASALDEDSDDEDEERSSGVAPDGDDERAGTKYNYSWFHVIFCLAAMYVAMLLTDWCVLLSSFWVVVCADRSLSRNVVVSADTGNDGDYIRIGRSPAAMWMRIVSSWICEFRSELCGGATVV